MKFSQQYFFVTRTAAQKKLKLAILVSSLSVSPLSQALTFNPSQGVSVDWDSTITYGAQWRVQGPQNDINQGSRGSNNELNSFLNVVDNAFLINSNDGNNNFDTGLVANRLSLLTEADFRYQDYGLFFRAKAWFDPIYTDGETDNEDYGSYNANPIFGTNGGHSAGPQELTDAASDYNGKNAKFLDVFAYGSFDIGEHSLNIRAGRQVISWGEALLSGGGIATAINHVDAQIRNVPGLEIKEIFLPNGAIYGQFDLTGTINIETYYQYEWQPTFIDPAGSLFSEFDSIGQGGETFMFLTGQEDEIFGIEFADPDIQPFLPTTGNAVSNQALVPHLRKNEYARDSGQFGVAGRYLFDDGAELGVYFVRYHEKTPSFILPLDVVDTLAPTIETVINSKSGAVEGDANFIPFKGVQDLSADLGKDAIILLMNGFAFEPDALDYTIKYFEDVRLYGVSYNTVFGTSNVGMELNYRPNMPVMTGTVNRMPEREDVVHAHLNLLHVFGPTIFYDSSILTAEAVAWGIPGREDANGTHDPSRLAVQNTSQGWGYSVLWNLEYKNVLHGTDLTVPIYINHGVNGAMLTSGYRNKQVTVSVGLTAKYLSNLEYGISAVTYFGSKKDVFQRLLSDRDNISFNIKYGF